jgi:tRNA wybutosine-synthesizing protein 2
MGRSELPPAARVRARIAASLGPFIAEQLPGGYQRLGRVMVVRLPEQLRPHFRAIGEAWCAELGVSTVLRRTGETVGELRIPHFERVVGEDTTTEVVEYGIRYRLDAQHILFARGNRTERHRAGTVTRPGEIVADLFAGIGYFSLPAAVIGRARRVWAVEKNPASYQFLCENARINHVADRIECLRGDNREIELPAHASDRVFLGYLPSSVPWVPRALGLLSPKGGTLHVHLVVGTRDGRAEAEAEVTRAAIRAGATVVSVASRAVKAFGPGREHVVVDLVARPAVDRGG